MVMAASEDPLGKAVVKQRAGGDIDRDRDDRTERLKGDGGQHPSDRCRHRQRHRAHADQLTGGIGDLFGAFAQGSIVAHLDDHGELVSAEPGNQLARTDLPTQDMRRLDEQSVAELVAEGVVDLLEAVQIEE